VPRNLDLAISAQAEPQLARMPKIFGFSNEAAESVLAIHKNSYFGQ